MENDKLMDIFPVLWKRRWQVAGAVLASMILMSVVTLLQPNYYRSTASFYPVSHTLLQPIVQGTDRNFNYYGDDHDVDRLLAMANARETTGYVIDRFGLAGHYGIDTSTARGRVKLRKRFLKNYEVVKTRYDGIRISIEDQDPRLAADMCNAVLDKIDESATRIVKEAQRKIHRATSTNVIQRQALLDSLVTRITALRERYRVYDTQSQGEALATMEARDPASAFVRKKIEDYTRGVAEVKKLEGEREELSKLLVAEGHKADQLKAAYEMDQAAIHIIERAEVPEEKSRPRRSLYVLATGLFVFLAASLFVLAAESMR